MNYNPEKNEIRLSVESILGGTINEDGHLRKYSETGGVKDSPLIVGVHDSNIWIEVPGLIGFSLDKDMAKMLLSKISE